MWQFTPRRAKEAQPPQPATMSSRVPAPTVEMKVARRQMRGGWAGRERGGTQGKHSPTRTTTSREKQSAGGVAGARTAEGTLVVAAAVAHMISISVVTVIDIATRREAMDVSRCLGRQQLWVHHYCTCSPASAILLYMTTGITSPSIGIAPSVSKTPQNG